MRSMSMLQLLGGVAVAGAVAAGTTAFTAGSGLDKTAVVGKAVGGGSTSVTITGAELTKMNVLFDAGNISHITGVEVTLDGGTPGDLDDTATTVEATIAGTSGTSPAMVCANVSAGVWDCKDALPATNYYTAITTVTLTVAPVLA